MKKTLNVNSHHKVDDAQRKIAEMRAIEEQRQQAEEAAAAAQAEAEKAAERKENDQKIFGSKKYALYVKDVQFDTKLDEVKNFCLWSERTVEVMLDYDLTIDPEKVREYTLDPSKLKAAIIEGECSKYAKKDPYYKDNLTQRISSDLEDYAAFEKRGTDREDRISGEARFTTWNEESLVFEPNVEAMKEAFTVYAEGQEAYIWELLKDATDTLNEAFSGNAPFFLARLWDNKNGVLELNPYIDLSLYRKDQREIAAPSEAE